MPKVMTGTMGDARTLCPSAMSAVPLILDRVRKGIMDKVNAGTPVQIAIFNHCVNYKRRWASRGWRTPICDAIVFKKVALAMGGKLRAMISGGAPLSAGKKKSLNFKFKKKENILFLRYPRIYSTCLGRKCCSRLWSHGNNGRWNCNGRIGHFCR